MRKWVSDKASLFARAGGAGTCNLWAAMKKNIYPSEYDFLYDFLNPVYKMVSLNSNVYNIIMLFFLFISFNFYSKIIAKISNELILSIFYQFHIIYIQ